MNEQMGNFSTKMEKNRKESNGNTEERHSNKDKEYF